jgi:hypothetical protein
MKTAQCYRSSAHEDTTNVLARSGQRTMLGYRTSMIGGWSWPVVDVSSYVSGHVMLSLRTA